jgi:hypothetical protein
MEAAMEYAFSVELLDRELKSIGRIVALWGSLEREIFCQTLVCFDVTSPSQLPKEMNNMSFSSVLKLWDSHLVSKATGKRKQVLQDQYKKIGHYHDFRNALVHGMWEWSKDKPAKITATRIRRAEVIRTHFTADDLEDLASELETINFNVRYPGGLDEFARAKSRQGVYMSRMAVCLMTGDPLADEYLRSFGVKQREKNSRRKTTVPSPKK